MKSSTHSAKLGIISLVAALALPMLASAGQTVPTPKKTVAPHLSSALRDASGEVRLLVEINEYGFVTDAQVAESTNSALDQASLSAIQEWVFTPAMEDGQPIASKAIQPFSFNHGSIVLAEKATPEDKHPSVKNSVSPELGDELRAITGEVVLQASVNASGKVESVQVKSSTHSELEPAAAAALEQWSFKPAVKAGQAIASQIIIPFHFEGKGTRDIVAKAKDSSSLDKAPVAIRQVSPELPRELRSERGEAKLKLTVDENGYVADVEVLESSNEALSAAATAAALQWKFKPAVENGQAIASKVVQPFSLNGGLLMADLPVDSMPVVKRSVSPKLPEQLNGVMGYVKVRLDLDAQGRVVNASSTKSSHDELVQPTIEAAKSWTFKPAVRDGEEVSSSVIVPFVFNEKG
ncbi:TonB family protein [Pelagicoccus sp. SDUM812003]|uniref:TonB family protein n=1 Tax=Pelagicoccus sp. SDUM812003 TaxID=3041267 RepID=UPI00280D943D|nr:TonB family protein [Pelagicoccus sp. SDUM812003]MDQ8205179.1 TonB family protein [Pelagicoccus sp. SDUM812003]